ncbi:hypothetical protein CEUSTIGMA_g201.t1 [Chlamydomonas eustigma]|uniref:TRAF-type domain-containing protein n=1 Tax=Chlamydomonas eustigma TaxID=1157962 RepID=A0A250WPH7_9CHLO|nr:hypothetical protein CEUSTIGMA_g201.t1 [Chlamydomonas eustigma]|eukprot:GAX72745.1 hypothetical protein CEUSTIGMA_g201.t1 [Chlamydomonas eustigma]
MSESSRKDDAGSSRILPKQRPRWSVERVFEGLLRSYPGIDEPLLSNLQCPICLEVLQLPVNLICFTGCPGTQTRANNTCLRSSLCQHCANSTLQLNRPAQLRFLDTNGMTRCIICRKTAVKASALRMADAYYVNHTLMDVMDALGLAASCRLCEKDFTTQSNLQKHYQCSCPHAVVQCRFQGCNEIGLRTIMSDHECTCPVGRTPCLQCSEYVDKDELLPHTVNSCRFRIVTCIMCKHRARLPDMVFHLRLHQTELQRQMLALGVKRSIRSSPEWPIDDRSKNGSGTRSDIPYKKKQDSRVERQDVAQSSGHTSSRTVPPAVVRYEGAALQASDTMPDASVSGHLHAPTQPIPHAQTSRSFPLAPVLAPVLPSNLATHLSALLSNSIFSSASVPFSTTTPVSTGTAAVATSDESVLPSALLVQNTTVPLQPPATPTGVEPWYGGTRHLDLQEGSVMSTEIALNVHASSLGPQAVPAAAAAAAATVREVPEPGYRPPPRHLFSRQAAEVPSYQQRPTTASLSYHRALTPSSLVAPAAPTRSTQPSMDITSQRYQRILRLQQTLLTLQERSRLRHSTGLPDPDVQQEDVSTTPDVQREDASTTPATAVRMPSAAYGVASQQIVDGLLTEPTSLHGMQVEAEGEVLEVAQSASLRQRGSQGSRTCMLLGSSSAEVSRALFRVRSNSGPLNTTGGAERGERQQNSAALQQSLVEAYVEAMSSLQSVEIRFTGGPSRMSTILTSDNDGVRNALLGQSERSLIHYASCQLLDSVRRAGGREREVMQGDHDNDDGSQRECNHEGDLSSDDDDGTHRECNQEGNSSSDDDDGTHRECNHEGNSSSDDDDGTHRECNQEGNSSSDDDDYIMYFGEHSSTRCAQHNCGESDGEEPGQSFVDALRQSMHHTIERNDGDKDAADDHTRFDVQCGGYDGNRDDLAARVRHDVHVARRSLPFHDAAMLLSSWHQATPCSAVKEVGTSVGNEEVRQGGQHSRGVLVRSMSDGVVMETNRLEHVATIKAASVWNQLNGRF